MSCAYCVSCHQQLCPVIYLSHLGSCRPTLLCPHNEKIISMTHIIKYLLIIKWCMPIKRLGEILFNQILQQTSFLMEKCHTVCAIKDKSGVLKGQDLQKDWLLPAQLQGHSLRRLWCTWHGRGQTPVSSLYFISLYTSGRPFAMVWTWFIV